MTAKKARGSVDWEACEADYRAGTLSNRQMAELHGCGESAIRDRAKRYGWQKDLSVAVRDATNAKLLRSDLRTELRSPNARSDIEIVSDAAEVRVALVREHRKNIGAGREIVWALFAELQEATENRAEIEEAIEVETARGGKIDSKRRASMLKAVSLSARAGAVANLAVAMKNLVGLERQAFSLTDKPEQAEESGEIVFRTIYEQKPAALIGPPRD